MMTQSVQSKSDFEFCREGLRKQEKFSLLQKHVCQSSASMYFEEKLLRSF